MDDWKEECDKLYIGSSRARIKVFIQSLLDHQKKELLRKIRLDHKTPPRVDTGPRGRLVYERSLRQHERGYNNAVENLEELKKSLSQE